MTTPLDAPYVDQVMMPDLNDPPAKCCDRTGFCACGEYMTVGFPHTHEVERRELVVTG
ncbi:MAG TPA: hypothetical protein VFR23_25560 [Jiangellaceae bacterium]|nr:hypothetical protein [Jiangellaceae bacterium]